MTTFPVIWTDRNGAHSADRHHAERQSPIIPAHRSPAPWHGRRHQSHVESGLSPGMNFDLDFVPPLTIDRGWHGCPNVGIWGDYHQPHQAGQRLTRRHRPIRVPDLELRATGAEREPGPFPSRRSAPSSVRCSPVSANGSSSSATAAAGCWCAFFSGQPRRRESAEPHRRNRHCPHPHQGSQVADFAAQVHKGVGTHAPSGRLLRRYSFSSTRSTRR